MKKKRRKSELNTLEIRNLCFECIWRNHITAIVYASKVGKCSGCGEKRQIVRV